MGICGGLSSPNNFQNLMGNSFPQDPSLVKFSWEIHSAIIILLGELSHCRAAVYRWLLKSNGLFFSSPSTHPENIEIIHNYVSNPANTDKPVPMKTKHPRGGNDNDKLMMIIMIARSTWQVPTSAKVYDTLPRSGLSW